MPPHGRPKRAAAAPPQRRPTVPLRTAPRPYAARSVWALASCAVALTGAGGAVAIEATSAVADSQAPSITATTGTTTTGTTTSATATGTTATTATTTATDTTTTATAETDTTTAAPGATSTAADTVTAATDTTAAVTDAAPAATATSTADTATTATTATVPTTATTAKRTPAKPTSAEQQSPAWIQTVTVTVTAPTATPTPSSDDIDGDGQTDASVLSADTDPLSTSIGVDSSTLEAQTALTEAVVSADPPKALVRIYKAAGTAFDVPWQVLAAINAVETDYGHDDHTSSAGAEGVMQFEPATFSKYAVATGDGQKPSLYNTTDAIFAAAHLLAANGAATDLRRAIYAYNHADWYVDEVTFVASLIVGAETSKSATSAGKITAMQQTAQVLTGTPYLWGGGHSGWTASFGYDCSGFVSVVLHAAGYLKQPQSTQTLPDASGMESGPGRYVTIFDRTDSSQGITGDHVIIDIDGQWWESGGGAGDGGADDVHRITNVTSSYLASFNVELHPQGL